MDDGRTGRRYLALALCFALVTLSLSMAVFADTAAAKQGWAAGSIDGGDDIANAVPADSGPADSGVYPHGREPHGPPATPTESKPVTPTPTEVPRTTPTESAQSASATAESDSTATTPTDSSIDPAMNAASETTEPDETSHGTPDHGGSLSTAGPLAAFLTALLLGSALVAIRRRR
ncbi:hypothetical protein KTS45_09755 [Halomicroarcula limicola]|uniref:Uncharacterized protein n=1 Tax=Haloarcula limicola TaxID=1429915 RepID=A0A8J7Y9V2_9EURY|nr:hypothetical protein [Halomicroarcula limicola]MBV0924483.1 hypothetical protein [Halomicroarcula limicola]